jgi:hypothetical protein
MRYCSRSNTGGSLGVNRRNLARLVAEVASCTELASVRVRSSGQRSASSEPRESGLWDKFVRHIGSPRVWLWERAFFRLGAHCGGARQRRGCGGRADASQQWADLCAQACVVVLAQQDRKRRRRKFADERLARRERRRPLREPPR